MVLRGTCLLFDVRFAFSCSSSVVYVAFKELLREGISNGSASVDIVVTSSGAASTSSCLITSTWSEGSSGVTDQSESEASALTSSVTSVVEIAYPGYPGFVDEPSEVQWVGYETKSRANLETPRKLSQSKF